MIGKRFLGVFQQSFAKGKSIGREWSPARGNRRWRRGTEINGIIGHGMKWWNCHEYDIYIFLPKNMTPFKTELNEHFTLCCIELLFFSFLISLFYLYITKEKKRCYEQQWWHCHVHYRIMTEKGFTFFWNDVLSFFDLSLYNFHTLSRQPDKGLASTRYWLGLANGERSPFFSADTLNPLSHPAPQELLWKLHKHYTLPVLMGPWGCWLYFRWAFFGHIVLEWQLSSRC